MADAEDHKNLLLSAHHEPRLSISYELHFIGDWGQANFHRICSWLTQEFCDRAGPESRTAIWSIRHGGIEAITKLADGEVDLAVATPASFMQNALGGKHLFNKAMPHLRALAVLPQNDRMVLALDPKYNIKTMAQLREQKPPIRLATSTNDGTNFIGFVADKFLEAHQISQNEIESWGGKVLRAHRPEQCTAFVENGEADSLLQEAIMTPWWAELIEGEKLSPLPAELEALKHLEESISLGDNPLPSGFWANMSQDLPALNFSDFVILVREDMPAEVAYLLTWCLVETRKSIEKQYKHIPPSKSPLTYPLEPAKMLKTPVPLHSGARRYYGEANLL
ncbi:hypothetical protein H2204_002989 [Knufia peltigerae]|uniref:Uncharacterized protein n=1 Tax=Knufia peltigerae TaxID=1002370 RepID=A0AA38YAE1_9EURO|nr:hypothetical protein H2204_002989 [Knufia peltigerae]